MGRVFIIARSEFITAVRARGFLIGIMLDAGPVRRRCPAAARHRPAGQSGSLVTWPSSTTRASCIRACPTLPRPGIAGSVTPAPGWSTGPRSRWSW